MTPSSSCRLLRAVDLRGAVLTCDHAGVSHVPSTLLSLALAGLMALAAFTDPWLVAAVVVVVVMLIAVAPGPIGDDVIEIPRAATVAGAGLVATALAMWPRLLDGADGTSDRVFGHADNGMLAAVMPAIVVAVFIALATQMLRTDGRAHLVPTASYAVALGVFAALTVGWIGALKSFGDAEVVAVGAAGVAAGVLTWLLPIDRWICGSLAMAAGAVAGVAVVLNVDTVMTAVLGGTVGATAALFAVLGQVLGRAWAEGQAHAAAGWGLPGALSIALAAPIVYIGGQLIGAPGL